MKSLRSRNQGFTFMEMALTLFSVGFLLSAVPGLLSKGSEVANSSPGSAPAEEFFVNGTSSTVGIIGSVTRPFCGACDRLRLTSDGQIRSCLFSNEEVDLRKVLRDSATDSNAKREEIASRFQKTVLGKLPGHGINDPSFIAPSRPMSAIGG